MNISSTDNTYPAHPAHPAHIPYEHAKSSEPKSTMQEHRAANPDVEIYLAMSYKFSLPPEIADLLDDYQLWNPTAKQLAARLTVGHGKLGKNKEFTPMYQNCSRTTIHDIDRLGNRLEQRFWVSFRSYKGYQVALIQPDNRSDRN